MLVDLLSYWGSEKLRTCSSSDTAHLAVPPSSKEFLERVGLPIINDPRFCFEPEVPPFARIEDANRFRRLGLYDASPICVEDGTGSVYMYDEENRSAVFMNSSLESFASSLTIYEQMLVKARSETKSEQQRLIVGDAEQQMRLIDPSAFHDDESFWPVVFEEIGYELN